MKKKKMCFFTLPVLFICIITWSPNVNADPSGGGSAAVSVADIVHSAADVASLSNRFDSIIAESEKVDSPGRKTELLNQAKDILTKLTEQANNVESEITILSKKKLDKVYVEKLDRILSRVLQIRTEASKKMKAGSHSG